MLKRALVAVLSAISVAGCAGGPIPAAASTGTITGHVQVRVCGGAARSDQPPCQVNPAHDAVLTFDAVTPATTGYKHYAVTDATGAYAIALAPGTYRISLASYVVTTNSLQSQAATATTAPPRILAGPKQVSVVAGKTVTADFAYLIELL